jgi:hypothetical protein
MTCTRCGRSHVGKTLLCQPCRVRVSTWERERYWLLRGIEPKSRECKRCGKTFTTYGRNVTCLACRKPWTPKPERSMRPAVSRDLSGEEIERRYQAALQVIRSRAR